MLNFFLALTPRHWQFQLTDSFLCHYNSPSSVLPFKNVCCNKKKILLHSPLSGGRKVMVNNCSQPELLERIPHHTLRGCSATFFTVPLSNHWMMLDGNRRNSKTSSSLTVKWDLSKTSQSCQFVHVLKKNRACVLWCRKANNLFPVKYISQKRKETECIDSNFLLISQVLISPFDIFIVQLLKQLEF